MIINQRKSVFAGILLGCWLAWGCEKEVIVPDLKGNLVGYVNLYTDLWENVDDASGVTIKTTGSDRLYETTSDVSGRFEFSNLPAGTYDLEFSREGYGTTRMNGIRHLGGEPTIIGYISDYINPVGLYQFPATIINSITLQGDTIIGDFTFTSKEPTFINLVFYLSELPEFDLKDARAIYAYTFNRMNGIYQAYLFRSELPFDHGQTVYYKVRICSSPVPHCLEYIDDNTYIDCNFKNPAYLTLSDEYSSFSYIFP